MLPLLFGCSAAIVGAGAFVLSAGIGVLAATCDEPIVVEVRDGVAAHPVCDATVVAESDGHVVRFSPCYEAYVGEGSWKIVATKAGFQGAPGVVDIPHGRRCSEPTLHSVEITLAPIGRLAATTVAAR